MCALVRGHVEAVRGWVGLRVASGLALPFLSLCVPPRIAGAVCGGEQVQVVGSPAELINGTFK